MRILLGGLFTVLGFWSVAVWADGPLNSEMYAYLVQQDTPDQLVQVEASEVAPGAVLEYRLVYTNTSGQPLSGLVVTGPIPSHTAYLEDSAHADVPATLTVSADDGARFAPAPLLDPRSPSGAEPVVIPAGDYTHLRWQPEAAIQPGQVQTYRYRVRVR